MGLCVRAAWGSGECESDREGERERGERERGERERHVDSHNPLSPYHSRKPINTHTHTYTHYTHTHTHARTRTHTQDCVQRKGEKRKRGTCRLNGCLHRVVVAAVARDRQYDASLPVLKLQQSLPGGVGDSQEWAEVKR